MIYGIGTDIVRVPRLARWVENGGIIRRFFPREEIIDVRNVAAACEHYAARFAAKEAFGKALGTGLFPLTLSEIVVTNGAAGEPHLTLTGNVRALFDARCPDGTIFVSLSHEKEYAVATVVIEVHCHP
ncbi:MAG: holo-ACP synthase [Treponema sp.]|nr:holo-ACP synthase [Treponema sp.]